MKSGNLNFLEPSGSVTGLLLLFLVTTQQGVVIPYKRFGTTLKMGPTGCHETSVWNYHYSLGNNPEERSA